MKNANVPLVGRPPARSVDNFSEPFCGDDLWWWDVSGQFMDNIDFQYFNAFMLIGLGEHVGN